MKFEEKVGDPAWVTSGDLNPIGKCARSLTRQYHLDKGFSSEEFFKLCLDMGLGVVTATYVMNSVKKLRQ